MVAQRLNLAEDEMAVNNAAVTDPAATDRAVAAGQTADARADAAQTRRDSLTRLVLLMQAAPGAWAFAIFEDGAVRRAVMDALRQQLAPQPVIDIALADADRNLLDLLAAYADQPAAVLAFYALPTDLRALSLTLEIQRDALARQPQRLLFWLSRAEYAELLEQAPNFTSRLSAVFHFPGFLVAAPADGAQARHSPAVDWGALHSAHNRRRPYVQVADERERAQRVAYFERRITELQAQPHPDWREIGDAWYDVAGLHERATPRRWQEAEAAYLQAAAAYRRSGRTLAAAEAHYQAGAAASRDWRIERAQTLLTEALHAYEMLEDSPARTPLAAAGKADVWYELADLLRTHGQYDEAERLYRESLRVFEAVGDTHAVAATQSSLADLLRTRGQYDEAERLYRESLRVFEAVGDTRAVAVTQSSLADLLSLRGQYDEAERLYRESLRVFEAVGDTRSVAVTQSSLADLLRTRGQYDEAERLYRESLRVFAQVPDPLGTAYVQRQLGELALRCGRLQDALPLLEAARQGFVTLGLDHWLPGVDELLARARGETLTLDDLLGLVWAARRGDHAAGERALDICSGLLGSPEWASIAHALRRALAHEPLDQALAELPAAQRQELLPRL